MSDPDRSKRIAELSRIAEERDLTRSEREEAADVWRQVRPDRRRRRARLTMSDTVYLEEHPPARQQFYTTRQSPVTGLIVVHTAENTPDLVLPDAGAEAVARFISTRSDAGSYHSIVDSDSIVRVGRYLWVMFHVRGFNTRSLGLSFACRAAQWATLPEAWVAAAIKNGAMEAALMAAWVKAQVGVTVPAKRITLAEAEAGRPGFIDHALLDLARRSDPGKEFPWEQFLEAYARLSSTIYEGTPPMPPVSEEYARQIQQVLVDAGFSIGTYGPNGDGVDGDVGPATVGGLRAMAGELGQLRDDVAEVTGERDELRAGGESDTDAERIGRQFLDLFHAADAVEQ